MSTNASTTQQPSGITFPAEYRFAKLDSVNFEARNGRAAETIWRVAHTVEVGARSYEFSERLATPPNPQTWTPPHAKGAPVLVTIEPTPAEVIVAGKDGKNRNAKGLFRLQVLSIRPAAAGASK